jgi:hypothetical protein
VTALLEQREAEELAQRRGAKAEVRATWDQQAALPKNQAAKRAQPIDLHACGPAAGQRFAGDDASVFDRDRLQKAQMKSWSTQQMAEKVAKQREDAAGADRYAAYVRMLTERQQRLEDEERSAAKADRCDREKHTRGHGRRQCAVAKRRPQCAVRTNALNCFAPRPKNSNNPDRLRVLGGWI